MSKLGYPAKDSLECAANTTASGSGRLTRRITQLLDTFLLVLDETLGFLLLGFKLSQILELFAKLGRGTVGELYSVVRRWIRP